MTHTLICRNKDLHLSLVDSVDLSSTAQLKEEFERVMSSDITTVRVSAAGLDYIDSSGVASLLFIRKLCIRFNASMVIESISPAAARVIQLANLDVMLGLPKVAVPVSAPASSLLGASHSAEMHQPKFSDADALAVLESNSSSEPVARPVETGSFSINPPSFL